MRRGDQHTEESKRKISEAMKIASKFNTNRWSGGDYNFFHHQAWKLFGRSNCERCGISNDQHILDTGRRLHMHCRHQNYHKMRADLWECLCGKCHINETRREKLNVN
jgi:hypothetical protein